MTKLKAKKKMSKSTLAIIIMALVMAALLAFGGTYAYFTAQSATRTKDFHVGKVALSSTGTFAVLEERNAVPGDAVLTGSVEYTNESTVDTYIAVVFDILYKGGYYVYDGAEWTRKETDGYKNLTNYQINEAFGDVLAISDGGIINGKFWVQGTDADNKNVYIMRASEGNASLRVQAPIDADTGAMIAESSRTTTFVDATVDKPVKITKELKRKYQEYIVTDNEGKETGTEIKMVIPEEDYLGNAWNASTNNIYLEWEDADITIQFTAYQIQADHISDTDDAENNDTLTAEQEKDVNTVWSTMKELVGYTTVQNFITA